MRLNPANFFTHFFLLNHKDPELDKQDQDLTLGLSITLGILSLGTLHATCALIRWCITPADINDKVIQNADLVGRTTLAKSNNAQEEVKVQTDQKKEERIDLNHIDELSKVLTAENFETCMHLALEHNVPDAIWRGLAFAAENPENQALKKLIPTFKLFASPMEKQLGELIELGKECHTHKIIPSMSPRCQRSIRLECESFKFSAKKEEIGKGDPDNYLAPEGRTAQHTIWTCLKKVQTLAPVEELDTGEYEIGVDKGHDRNEHDCNHYRFIRQAASFLPTLRELKLSFNSSIDLKEGFGDENNTLAAEDLKNGKFWNLFTLLTNSFPEIEGIGLSFPYEKDKTEQYLAAFKDNALVSQNGIPIQLRSLTLKGEDFSNDQLQELFEQFPLLHQMSISNAPITHFPNFPQLERLELDTCSQVEELDQTKVRHLRILCCNAIETIQAPLAEDITILGARGLKTLHADQAKHLMLHETGLKSVELPSAKTLHFVPPDNKKVSISEAPDLVKVPEECVVGRSGSCDIERFPSKTVV